MTRGFSFHKKKKKKKKQIHPSEISPFVVWFLLLRSHFSHVLCIVDCLSHLCLGQIRLTRHTTSIKDQSQDDQHCVHWHPPRNANITILSLGDDRNFLFFLKYIGNRTKEIIVVLAILYFNPSAIPYLSISLSTCDTLTNMIAKRAQAYILDAHWLQSIRLGLIGLIVKQTHNVPDCGPTQFDVGSEHMQISYDFFPVCSCFHSVFCFIIKIKYLKICV